MKATAITFQGHCRACGKYSDTQRGAVSLDLDGDDDIGDWICFACALKLAKRLQRAVSVGRLNLSRGLIYRSDRWQKAGRKALGIDAP